MKQLTPSQEMALRELVLGPLLPLSRLYFARGLRKPLIGAGTVKSLASAGYARIHETRVTLSAAGLDACILRKLAPATWIDSSSPPPATP